MPGDSRKAKEAIVAQVKQAEKAPEDYFRDVTWGQMVQSAGSTLAFMMNEMEKPLEGFEHKGNMFQLGFLMIFLSRMFLLE